MEKLRQYKVSNGPHSIIFLPRQSPRIQFLALVGAGLLIFGVLWQRFRANPPRQPPAFGGFVAEMGRVSGDWKEAVGELIGGFTLRLLLWVGCSVLASASGLGEA
ncbi:MAG: hypothetical protein KME26_14585 [Oscillatoria princeps RMCB-10]|nr:hypothetical protein [Oscillatoria princeps RMCB-10]